MTKLIKALFYLLSLFVFTANCFAQEFADIYFYDLFNANVGIESTDLYQGTIYAPAYRISIDKTPFFKNKNFVKGTVVYDGQFYHNLDLKYDVSGDRVLMKLITKTGGGTLILFKDILERFEIDGRDFVKIEKEDAPEIGVYGFFEISLKSSSLTLYTKYKKKRVTKKERKSLYYEFVDTPSLYVLHYNNTYHLLKSKKDVKNLFPSLKKEIDKFYASSKRLKKSSKEDFQVALFKRIEALLSQNTNALNR